MKKLMRVVQDRGASAVEYGLLVAAVAALIVGVIFALGGVVKGAFDHTCSTIASYQDPNPSCDVTKAQVPPPGQ